MNNKDIPVVISLVFAAGVLGYTLNAPYTAALERILATCVDQYKPGTIKIGDEHFMCQIFPIGEFK